MESSVLTLWREEISMMLPEISQADDHETANPEGRI